MSTTEALARKTIPVNELTGEAFRPYGEIIAARGTRGQFVAKPDHPEHAENEPRLVLSNGEPRLWIMHLKQVGITFSKMARHRRVTQCLGALGGKDWLIAVAPPGDLDDGARPRLTDIAGFRIPGDCIVKLHLATWHAGPHLTDDECLFFNLENVDTNSRDFHSVDLGIECRFAV